jgi:G8 domain
MMVNKFLQICIAFCLLAINGIAATKTSTGSTNWGTNSTWSPSGVPTASDDVIIAANHTVSQNVNSTSCKTLTVNASGTLNIPSGKTLTIANTTGLTVNGTLNINSGNITLTTRHLQLEVQAQFYGILEPIQWQLLHFLLEE